MLEVIMMVIKANYDELLNTEARLKEESDKLDAEVENLLSVIEEVKNSWKGVDSDIFTGKAEAYIKNIKQISGSTRNFASFIKYASKSYETRDLRWKKEVEEAGANFGDQELKHRDE